MQVPVGVDLNLAESLLENDSLLNACNKLTSEHCNIRIDRNRVDTCSNKKFCELRIDTYSLNISGKSSLRNSIFSSGSGFNL